MNLHERRLRLRAILEGDSCVHPGSVFDPISARIAADLGFELGMFAGSTASLTVLGAPDIVVLTLSEFADQIRRIARAAPLPLLVDADHGYGNALSVMRTVEECEAAGVAGMTIEDTELPRRYGEGRPTLLSQAEGVGKMRAALQARTDPATVIVGRTSAISMTGIDDAVSRTRAYAEAGVDAIFVTGASKPEQVTALREATKLPIILGGAAGDLGDRAAMAALGVRVALQGHHPIMAAIRAVHETLKALRDGAAPAALANQPTPDLIRRVTRLEHYEEATKDFLNG